MYRETNRRFLFKGVSWRVLATTTTILIVYLFFGRLDLAIAAGAFEWCAKILLFWLHEKIWAKIRWGKKKIEPFNLWITGLPVSGKTTIGDKVYKELQKFDIPLERIDSRDVRAIVPDLGFSREERNEHITRVGHLVKVLQHNSISTVCSFVTPYSESRKSVRQLVKNNIVVYLKTDIESCKKRDTKGVYEKAMQGIYTNFTGISDIYEEPIHAEIVIDTDKLSVDQAVCEIMSYVKKHYLR